MNEDSENNWQLHPSPQQPTPNLQYPHSKPIMASFQTHPQLTIAVVPNG